MKPEFKQPISSNPLPRKAADPDGWVSEPRFWVWREVQLRACPAANTLATLFALATACWYASVFFPNSFNAIPFLTEHFFLTPAHLDAGRYYCFLTYPFLAVTPLPLTAITFAGLVLFGYAAERRVGPLWTVVLFFAASIAGGAAGLYVGSDAGHEAVDRIARGVGSAFVGDLVTRFLHMGIPITGPAAAIGAFIAVAVLVRAYDGKPLDNLWASLVAVIYLVAVARITLGEAGPGVNAAARAAGFLVGLLAAVGRGLALRKVEPPAKKPWPGRLRAAALFAVPVIAWFIATPPPGFSATNFQVTCFWLERAAWPVIAEPTTGKVDHAAHQAHMEEIKAAVAGVKDAAVEWELTPSRWTPREISFPNLYFVNAGAFTSKHVREGNEFAGLDRLRKSLGKNRVDVGIVLLIGGHDTVAIPVTNKDEMQYASQLTEYSKVPVSAVVERIEAVIPNDSDMLSGIARCEFRIHAKELKLRR